MAADPVSAPRTADCIESDWPQTATGYRRRSIEGRPWYAHRWVWTEAFGPIPDGLHVCHTCDNRSCVNPAHLWLGTNAQNTADKVAKGRQAHGEVMRQPMPGERNGRARLTEQDVRYIRAKHAVGLSVPELATRFGVDQTIIRRVVRRDSWSHVV